LATGALLQPAGPDSTIVGVVETFAWPNHSVVVLLSARSDLFKGRVFYMDDESKTQIVPIVLESGARLKIEVRALSGGLEEVGVVDAALPTRLDPAPK
jgi:hypothetical protein